jgi:hypothetical protein
MRLHENRQPRRSHITKPAMPGLPRELLRQPAAQKFTVNAPLL